VKLKRVLLLLLSASFANSATNPESKPASKPISRYMRDVGILYLEAVEQLSLDWGGRSSSDDDCMGRWESTMQSIEDRG